MRLKQEMECQQANLKLSEEVKLEVAQLDMKLSCNLSSLAGNYPDEVTLLTNLAIKHFQCFLEMDYVEQEQTDNQQMRFYGTLRLNGHVVGKGFGSNKKQVKLVASRLALQNLAPNLYKQWLNSLTGKQTNCLEEKEKSDNEAELAESSESDCEFELVPCDFEVFPLIEFDQPKIKTTSSNQIDKENNPPFDERFIFSQTCS